VPAFYVCGKLGLSSVRKTIDTVCLRKEENIWTTERIESWRGVPKFILFAKYY
jgi:hypothetical protein